jgi:hypothetical protein
MRLYTDEAFRSELGPKPGSGSERTRKLWCHCLARPQDVQTPYPGPLASISVLRIHEILVRIRIRGSIPLTNGSESGRPKNIWILRIRIRIRIRNTVSNIQYLQYYIVKC